MALLNTGRELLAVYCLGYELVPCPSANALASLDPKSLLLKARLNDL